MYDKIAEILDLCWKDDDRMDQDTLFTLQEKVADVLLEVANQEGRLKECVHKYEWIYKSWYSINEEE